LQLCRTQDSIRRLLHLTRSWTEPTYPNLIHYNQLEKGRHFAAWEQPKLLVDEMRAGLKSLRQLTSIRPTLFDRVDLVAGALARNRRRRYGRLTP